MEEKGSFTKKMILTRLDSRRVQWMLDSTNLHKERLKVCYIQNSLHQVSLEGVI